MNTIEFYNLSAEFRELLAAIESADGVMPAEVEVRFDELLEDTEAGVVQFALACRELERSASAIEQEEQRLAAKKRAKRNTVETLRLAITEHMARTDTPRVKSDLVTVSLLKGVERPIFDGKDENIPEKYRRTLVEHRLDKDLVMRDLADGVPLPEGIRIRRTPTIQIR